MTDPRFEPLTCFPDLGSFHSTWPPLGGCRTLPLRKVFQVTHYNNAFVFCTLCRPTWCSCTKWAPEGLVLLEESQQSTKRNTRNDSCRLPGNEGFTVLPCSSLSFCRVFCSFRGSCSREQTLGLHTQLALQSHHSLSPRRQIKTKCCC